MNGLQKFWDDLLCDVAFQNSWWNHRFTRPGLPDFRVSRELEGPALSALAVRRYEKGFLEELVRLHAPVIDQPLDLKPFLAITPHFRDRVEQVIEVLRRVLAISEPVVHLGLIDRTLPRPESSALCVASRSGGYANGAGTMTDFGEWRLDVYRPGRLRVSMEVREEYGTESDWSIELQHGAATEVKPLLDAFLEAGLHVTDKVAAL